MSALAGRHSSTRQRGAALLVFLMIVVTAALTFAVNNLTPEAVEARRMQKTQQALATAKQALHWYLQTFRDRQYQIDANTHYAYGYLPLPDLGSNNNTNVGCTTEGCDANLSGSALNKTIIGRLPWQLFGTGPLRDGHEECLWFIVSGSHQRVEKTVPMNWDTLGQIDIVTVAGASSETLHSILASVHDRPAAIIFSPGPRLPGQDRSANDGNNVSICGGNYSPANYLDPNLLIETTTSTYFAGAISNNTASTPLALQTQGKLYRENNAYRRSCSASNSACTLAGNDAGQTVKPDELFEQVRRNAYFRQDINSLLDRMVSCLRDTTPAASASKVPASACYADSVAPQNYFSHYSDMIFVSPATNVNGQGSTDCNGALLFASQRDAGQLRDSVTNRANGANYLEGTNLTGIQGSGIFSGPEIFARVSTTQSAAQDIVRCIPSTPNFVTVTTQAATGLPPLASYAPATQTLTLGQTVSTTLNAAVAGYLYGCAWKPETHAMGGGLRSYFMFRINDAGFSSAPAEGITFAIVDGDHNDITACGAAAQHMGYSGNNNESAFIVPPKIGFEIDPRASRNQHPTDPNFYFDETVSNPLNNGRNDPATTSSQYRGGHVGFVYWGGDSSIGALAAEQDDNVHGHPLAPYSLGRTGYPIPPTNPSAPNPPLSVPPDIPQGIYKLDPSRSAVPVNKDIHVRVELTRTPSDANLAKARVATTTALNLATPGAAIDNVFLVSGDRVLVKDQADAKENGVYVWSGSALALSRASDFNSAQALDGAVIEISQGAINARSLWHQTTASPTLGTATIGWHALRVKVATTQALTNVTAPGSRIDGILMKIGDRILVKDLGIYTWQSAIAALMPVAVHTNTVVQVQQGSDASGWWRYDGSNWSRQSVRVATQANITLATPGAVIDGITMANGDLILVKSQTTASENGLYTWSGAASALTPATWPAAGLMQVVAGSDSGRAYRQTASTVWASIDGSPSYTLEAWILQDSLTDANRIAAMKNTTRPMSLLSPTFTAHLRDTPKIPYPFRNVRLGYTIGQRNTVMDQSFTLSNAFTTWID
ncbi:MAG: hypothetical protein Q8M20_12545 [Rhodocyclaceae bacterium]|nr:hypothetical protein [Rhodocyclaceae bacterium]MDZ4213831.1 hypothetical protein [Rhodocyclaceae bacterium]